jgi:toxin YoeB
MNDLVFNELSVKPNADNYQQVHQQIAQLLRVCKEAKQQFGLNKLRFVAQLSQIDLLANYTFQDYIADTRTPSLHKNLLLGLFWYPFIDDQDETAMDAYINRDYSWNDEPCAGLAAAHIYNTLSASLTSDVCWQDTLLTINVVEQNETTRQAQVCNISQPHHLQHINITTWYSNKLLTQTLNPQNLSSLYPSYQFTAAAIEDLQHWQNHDQQMYQKVHALLHDILLHPFTGGLGQTEVLRYVEQCCSKRITREHRLTYWLSSNNDTQVVIIYRCKEHYQ